MNTIKNVVVVVLLLGVLYGAYVVLNRPSKPLPPGAAQAQKQLEPPTADLGVGASPGESFAPGAPVEGDLAAPPAPPAMPAQPPSAGAFDAPRSPSGSHDHHAGDRFAAHGPPRAAHPEHQPPARNQPAGGLKAGGDGSFNTPAKSSDVTPREGLRLVEKDFSREWAAAQKKIRDGKLDEGLRILSAVYTDPKMKLSNLERRKLVAMLDQLAGSVVYSSDYHYLPAHVVGERETLYDIARRYQAPWRVLQNINRVADPNQLRPDSRLKVVKGPFHALVDLERSELTLLVDGRYAGRFPITSGRSPQPVAGEYRVKEKRPGRDFYAGHDVVPAAGPGNPYGLVWIGLDDGLSLHGSPRNARPADTERGCMSLSPRDAEDVYSILSEGSSVTIRR